MQPEIQTEAQNQKNISVAILISFILLIIISFGMKIYIKNYGHKAVVIVSHEFHGTVNAKDVNGNILTVHGVFVSEKGTVLSAKPVDMIINVATVTKITRTTLTYPTSADLKKTNGMFSTNDLQKKTDTVDTKTLLSDLIANSGGIYVKSLPSQNIYNTTSFSANEVTYLIGEQSK